MVFLGLSSQTLGDCLKIYHDHPLSGPFPACLSQSSSKGDGNLFRRQEYGRVLSSEYDYSSDSHYICLMPKRWIAVLM
jgi:hypothetical protein